MIGWKLYGREITRQWASRPSRRWRPNETGFLDRFRLRFEDFPLKRFMRNLDTARSWTSFPRKGTML